MSNIKREIVHQQLVLVLVLILTLSDHERTHTFAYLLWIVTLITLTTQPRLNFL